MSDTTPPLPPKPGIVKEHARIYAATYFAAALFIMVTLLQAFVANFDKFKEMTSPELAAVTFMQWFFAVANMLISAGIVILAFTNKSLADANRKRENGGTPSIFQSR